VRTRRVVAVFAHPDDETILAGGTLAACAAKGVETALVCATRGELGPGGGPGRIGARREAELRAACRELGVESVSVLGFSDGTLADAGAELEEALTRALVALRPDAVVTFGPEGLYWHPDHLAVHEAVGGAADRLPAPVARLYATVPAGAIQALADEAHARGLGTDLWGLEPGAFGAPSESITTVVDVRAHLDRKVAALGKYASQFPSGHLLHGLPRDVAETHLGREYFGGAAGPDWLAQVLGPETASPTVARCS
jgi:N-acetyl-1-D-myo-inositol-2-amino-2-deoxy-alpha-D-glucopyranoside deacetylase